MVFRLPTPFDSLVPASNHNIHSRPWRGVFTLHGINLFRRTNEQQKLFVASAETEGDNQTDLWPKHFNVYLTQQSCRLSDIQAWVRRHDVPLCMFMPDRHATGPDALGNETHFRSLARIMIENQMVCIGPWSNPEALAGSGVLIFPNLSSTGLLIGAVFLNNAFPEFLLSDLPHPGGAVPSGLPTAQPYSSMVSSSIHSSSPEAEASRTSLGAGHDLTPPPPLSQLFSHGVSKGQMEGPISQTPALHQALAGVPFDWSFSDDTTDGSGNTSPGSSRAW
ncbi:hypothetical protein EW145_g6278 [Phellinidium pouzarii]|uniref:Uncharacterized protein n=1 Tax=Phellinidium pouzarii TaxID=167371 RepID=A0A4S4KX35_9AGAM|nr:hypothetical protein EW145_g6278 [Phellinidium pouzarii]